MSKVRFAVVGHPNKGKSSIVSTLSRNDTIEVSPRSGTTTHTEAYDVKIHDMGYQLLDTPGFQRPRQVLNWLRGRADNASERAQAVKAFVVDKDAARVFPDEVELLRPVIEGAAIIYVVDGSHPYGPEYEAEMEILRWCGQPRLALINPIEDETYINDWRQALDQYFSLVKVFNPMTASVQQQVELLSTFSAIAPHWKDELMRLGEGLKSERQQWRKRAAELLADFLIEACQFSVSQKVTDESMAEKIEPILNSGFKTKLKALEKNLYQSLLHEYRHMHSHISLEELDLPPELFDVEQWYLWGLDKKQLITSLAVSGIVAGGSIDLMVGGASALAGSIIGGISGLASGLISTRQLQDMKVKGVPLGGYEAQYGPVKSPNFPYLLINRFVHIHSQLMAKNHADRTELDHEIPSWELTLKSLGEKIRKQLQKHCGRLSRQLYVTPEELSETLEILLQSTE